MGYNSSILKSLAVLDCFHSDTEEYGIGDFGAKTSLPDSTVQRLVNSLEFAGLLYQNPTNKKYRLSLRAFRPLASENAAPAWLEQAEQEIAALRAKTNETVNLGIRVGAKLTYIAKSDSDQLLRPNFVLGMEYPLYCTGLGRCLLSHISREDIQEMFPTPLKRPVDDTPLSIDDLYETVAKTRKQGYYLDDEEFSLGLYCIAVPIFAFPGKVIAALSVSVPKVRITEENVQFILDEARQTAQRIGDVYRKLMGIENIL